MIHPVDFRLQNQVKYFRPKIFSVREKKSIDR
jgi:hypothetical protein